MLQELKSARLITYTLDPLLEFLTSRYIDDADLTDRLHRLFEVPRLHDCTRASLLVYSWFTPDLRLIYA